MYDIDKFLYRIVATNLLQRVVLMKPLAGTAIVEYGISCI